MRLTLADIVIAHFFVSAKLADSGGNWNHTMVYFFCRAEAETAIASELAGMSFAI
jgi:hypothetical protein